MHGKGKEAFQHPLPIITLWPVRTDQGSQRGTDAGTETDQPRGKSRFPSAFHVPTEQSPGKARFS